MSTHQSYAVRIDPAGVITAALIHAIGSQQISSSSNIQNEVHAGSPYPQCVTINSQGNEATVTTRDIANALSLVGTEGVALESNGFEAWALELDPLTGLHKTTDVHRLLSIARGKIVPVRMSCAHQEDATLDLRVLATKDPSTDYTDANLPITVATSQALPTGLAGDARFTLAGGTVAGNSLDNKLNVDIEFGVNISTEGDNSEPWDSGLIVESIQPSIIIRGKHIAAFVDSIGLRGAAGTHANTSLKFRKRLKSELGFVADATTEHVMITADGLAYWETVANSSNNGRIENQLRIACRHDGTNTPLVVDTASALT